MDKDDKIIKTVVTPQGEIYMTGESGEDYLLEYAPYGNDNWDSVCATKIKIELTKPPTK